MNNDIRIIANKLGVTINSLSAPFLNSYFLSLTPPEVEINMDETITQKPGHEREKTIWRPNEVELYYAIRWKVFLSYLPPSSSKWEETEERAKKDYNDVCKQYSNELEILKKENPIESYSTDSLTTQPTNMNDSLRRSLWEIKKDVKRTNFEQNICENRALLHKFLILHQLEMKLEYTQGFNEICAVLIDVYGKNKNEAEIYKMYKCIMDVLEDWYRDGEVGVKWIKNKCEVIQTILETKDEELAIHLKSINLEFHLFLIRWMRLLFCQVFPLKDVKRMWDVIFAFSGRLSLVDHICVVLIVLQRNVLLSADLTKAYTLLFNYPYDEFNVDFILNLALASCMWFEEPLIKSGYEEIKMYETIPLTSKEHSKIDTPTKKIGKFFGFGQQKGPKQPIEIQLKPSLVDKINEIEVRLRNALYLIDVNSDAGIEINNALYDVMLLRKEFLDQE